MAVANGTSVAGLQRIVGYGNLSVGFCDITIQADIGKPIVRVGTYYVSAKNNANPKIERVISHGIMYSPGTYTVLPTIYGFSTVQYAIDVRWNFKNLLWVCSYT